jgi:DNA-binding CsgD family transcriptional regulator
MHTVGFTLEQVVALLKAAHATHSPAMNIRQTAQRCAAELAKLVDADHSSIHLLHDGYPEPDFSTLPSLGNTLGTDRVARKLPECLTGDGVVTMFTDASFAAGRITLMCGPRIQLNSSAIVSIGRCTGNKAPAVISLGRNVGRPAFTDYHLGLAHAMHRAMPDEGRSPLPVHLNIDLPPRQRAVLKYLKEGRSEKQVAMELNLSHHTVHFYVKSIYKRFGVSSRSELLSLWLRRGSDVNV